jgi:dihydrofolate synthase / folylpolyglutamate synthase
LKGRTEEWVRTGTITLTPTPHTQHPHPTPRTHTPNPKPHTSHLTPHTSHLTPPMTYKETINYLYAQLPVYHRIGKAAYKADLGNALELDEYFGHPHKKFRSVHVAGTNGKGSVSHMIASVLQEAGFKTALYTSPHLQDYRERIKINGNMIPEDEVISFIEKHIDILNLVKASFFEMSVAMAYDFFARSDVEIAIIEVGLGGRLDSTNIITPLLSVITNIGHDHMDILGNTFEKVAGEKAGIIKKNVPIIIGEKHNLTKDVFIEKAADMKAELFFTEDFYNCRLENLNIESGKRKFCLTKKDQTYEICGETELGGDYQSKNIAVVALATDILRRHLQISSDSLIDGIRKTVINTELKGRFQIIGREPLMICDTGHNREGLEYVIDQVKRISKAKLHIVIGFVNDKDLSGVLPLFPNNATYYFTKASVPRALDENVLRSEAFPFGLRGDSFINVSLALEAAKRNSGREDMIFIGGSTFIVADLLRLL